MAHIHNKATSFPYLKAIRSQYIAEMWKRFTALKPLINETIIDNDFFVLIPGRVVTMATALKAPFEFTDNPAKVKAFMSWLRGVEDEKILEVTQRVGRGVVAHTEWQNIYVRRSYEKGIQFAEKKLAEAGITIAVEDLRAIFNRPIHADAIGMLYTRNFTELEGITEAMDQKMSRALAEGLSQGRNPRVIARALNKEVDNIVIVRARTLARTEVARAQNEATLNRYTDYGVKEVEGLLGPGPCPSGICDDIVAGGPYPLSEAEGLFPAHCNCGCCWAPVV